MYHARVCVCACKQFRLLMQIFERECRQHSATFSFHSHAQRMSSIEQTNQAISKEPDQVIEQFKSHEFRQSTILRYTKYVGPEVLESSVRNFSNFTLTVAWADFVTQFSENWNLFPHAIGRHWLAHPALYRCVSFRGWQILPTIFSSSLFRCDANSQIYRRYQSWIMWGHLFRN